MRKIKNNLLCRASIIPQTNRTSPTLSIAKNPLSSITSPALGSIIDPKLKSTTSKVGIKTKNL
jgi:hypothetical protein